MKILITGACGFVGSSIATGLLEHWPGGCQIVGIDNLSRQGSELNRSALRHRGVKLVHGDLRLPSDLETLEAVDWVIDAAANPSVLAGVMGSGTSRQLMEHNLFASVNVLEYCRAHRAGLVLLSTSRVYSIDPLSRLPMQERDGAFCPVLETIATPGLSAKGVSEAFPTNAPISLYGATKLASEQLALEYGAAFGFPVWIDRCGVFAGAGQFGKADQGIFSYWINSWLRRRPLRYIGFRGAGHQVRDAVHPSDIVALLVKQLASPKNGSLPAIVNLGGGADNAMSLAQLSDWCRARFGAHDVGSDPANRPFDVPWLVMDSSLASTAWGWTPERGLATILEEIAVHAEANPHWLDVAG